MNKLLILALIFFTAFDHFFVLSKTVSINIRVLYVDSNGDNLVGNSNSHINHQDLKLYYYNTAGENVKLFDGRLDNPDFIQQDSIFIVGSNAHKPRKKFKFIN